MKEKKSLACAGVAVLSLLAGAPANAATLEWADFINISVEPPINGSVSSASGGLTFDVNFGLWASFGPNNQFGPDTTTNEEFSWEVFYGLHGGGYPNNFTPTQYFVEFDNIFSHDASLFFSASALKSGHVATLNAYDKNDHVIDLSDVPLVDTFFGDGPTTWNGETGQFATYAYNGWSDHGGLLDFSGLNVDRLTVSYNSPGGDGFDFGIATHKKPVESASVDEPSSLLLVFSLGILGVSRKLLLKKTA